MIIPDGITPAVGWRAWSVVPGPVLASVGNSPICEPRERMTAECRLSGTHEAPDENCRYGIYAASSRERLGELPYGEYDLDRSLVRVVGSLYLWGGMVPADWGWRAQFAYPKRLYIPTELWKLAKPLREAYGIPVKVTNTFELLRKS